MNELQIFKYKGFDVTFKTINDKLYINATEMSKPFGKRPVDWIKLPTTISFLEALSIVRKSHNSDYQPVITKVGPPITGGGTWYNEDTTIEFARWLSPEYSIWCNDRIKEYQKFGITASPEKLEEIVNNPDLLIKLANQLKEYRQENQKLVEDNKMKEQMLVMKSHTIKEQEPKVDYHDNVLTSSKTFSATMLAKTFGMSAKSLNKKLHFLRVQYKIDNCWVLYSIHHGEGYTEYRTTPILQSDKTYKTVKDMRWTEAGQKFVYKILKNNGMLPKTHQTLF